LQSHTFSNFQMLLDKVIGLENKREELREQKRKFQSQGNLAVTLDLVTTCHKALSFVLVYKAEIMDRINSLIIRLINSNNSTE
jgi:hypothetical protein